MKPKEIQGIVKQKVNKLAALSEKISPGFDQEDVHEFRIAVKKLRSFIRLLEVDMDEPDLQMPQKFKRLYQILGALRDSQLELEAISNQNLIMPAYSDQLQNTLNARKQEWDERFSKKILGDLSTRYMNIKYEILAPAVLLEFISVRIAAVEKVSNLESPSFAQIHAVRKVLKDILFNLKLAKKNWKATYKQVEDLPEEQMSALADLIGEFNDQRQTLEHLDSFASKSMDETEEKTIKNLCKEKEAWLLAEQKNIMDKMKEFVRTVIVLPDYFPVIS